MLQHIHNLEGSAFAVDLPYACWAIATGGWVLGYAVGVVVGGCAACIAKGERLRVCNRNQHARKHGDHVMPRNVAQFLRYLRPYRSIFHLLRRSSVVFELP